MELLESSFKRNEEVSWRVVDDEAFLVSPKDLLVHPFSTVATRIWELLDGRKKLKGIIDIIDNEFEMERTVIEEDALAFIKELLDAELIEKRVSKKG